MKKASELSSYRDWHTFRFIQSWMKRNFPLRTMDIL